MAKTRKTTSTEQEAFQFLNVLRDSGATNMFGAAPYLQDELSIDKRLSRSLVTMWMSVFSDDGKYDEVPAKYAELNA